MESLNPTPAEDEPTVARREQVAQHADDPWAAHNHNNAMKGFAYTAMLDTMWTQVTDQIIADHTERYDEQPDDTPRTPHGL